MYNKKALMPKGRKEGCINARFTKNAKTYIHLLHSETIEWLAKEKD